jgi:hypothetical protein
MIFDTAYVVVCLWMLSQVPQDEIPMSPVKLFCVCAVISTIAGIASLLRTREEEKQITARLLISHSMNMGACGSSLSMILYAVLHPRDNLEWLIIGAAGLFSLGGMGSIDWVVALFRDSIATVFAKLFSTTKNDD